MSYVIPNSSVTTAKIPSGAVTQTQMYQRQVSNTAAPSGGILVTSNSGSFSTSSTTPVAITNCSGTLVTTGKLVRIEIIANGGSNVSLMYDNGASTNGVIHINRDGTAIASIQPNTQPIGCSVTTFDIPSAGTHTYSLTGAADTGGGSLLAHYISLMAYEIN